VKRPKLQIHNTVVRFETVDVECLPETRSFLREPLESNRLLTIDPLQDERWSDLVARHPASSVFHSKEWLSALRVAYGYEPVVFSLNEPHTPLTSGIVFCKVNSWLTGSRLVSVPFSDHCDPLVASSAEFDELLSLVARTLRDRTKDYCEVRPLRFQPSSCTGFGESDRYVWHTVDLRPPLDTILRRFHTSEQRKIRRSVREGLTYEEGNSERLLGHFYKLLVDTRRRQHLPPQPMKWFRSLIASFGMSLKIRVAFKDSEPIASILTISHHETVTYKYGCSDARMHAMGGVAMLFWNTIRQAKTDGHETFDLGRSEISNQGLVNFKEHWGGMGSNISYWRNPNHPRAHESSWKRKIAQRFVDSVPDRFLIASGRAFYKHIG